MKKITKKLATFALSATFAVSAGTAIGVVAYNHTPITASAEQTKTAEHDLTQAFVKDTWAGPGDYTEALLYRIKSPSYTAAYWSGVGAAAGLNHDLGETVMKNVLVNGKSIYDHNAEYKALIENGETSPITWTGMPENTGAPSTSKQYMTPEIASDVNGGTAVYAPILLKLCQHSGYGNSIDIYIPTSYIAKEDVSSIVISKDFYFEANGTSFGVSEDVVVYSWGIAPKKVDTSNYEIKEVSVTKIDGASNAPTSWDSCLRFHLDGSDYNDKAFVELKAADKAFLHSLNFYDHILLNGRPMYQYYTADPTNLQMFYNVWGSKDAFAVRWPHSLNSAEAAGKITEIKILKGCQFPSYDNFGSVIYETTEEKTFLVTGTNIYSNTVYAFDAEDVTFSEMIQDGAEKELYRVDIKYENWNSTCDTFDYNYFGGHYLNMRKAILINGKSLHEINTTVDDSEYVYSTSPWTNTATDAGTGYQLFQNPTLLRGEGDTLSVYIHKDYIASLEEPYVEVTLSRGFANHANSEYWAKEDISAFVYKAPLTVSVITGNQFMDPTCVTTVDCVYGDTFKVTELVAPTATGKTFAGWIDVNGEAITEDFAVTESTAIFASWTVTPYTLTIVNGEEETEFTFAVEYTNDILISVNDLAFVLADNLPAETNTHTYAWDVEVPETFALQNYTFTVVATERVYTVSVITGNPRLDPSCVTTTEHKYNDTFKVTELVAPTATGKTFAGWIDVEGNAITEDFAITESTSIFASWTVTPYTLTIKQEGKEDVVITFGVEYTNDILVSVNDLAFVLEDNLPADSEEFTYAWAEEVLETFELQNYTFTVVATPVEDTSSDTSSGDESTDTPNKPAKSGCGSAIGSTLAITGIALAASALIIKKRKED